MLKYLLNIGVFNSDTNYINLAIELFVYVVAFVVLTFVTYQQTKRRKTIIISAVYFVAGLIVCLLELELAKYALVFSSLMICVNLLLTTTRDAKFNNRNYIQTVKTPKSTLTDENAKEKLIETLISATAYLSSRKIGAIITIEKTQNLNTYIEKGVKLDAEVTVELLKTIFFPNTALHDGAVIIRGNRIMCAGTFYTPSDKPDINSELGSRHRAAIGISEDSDAFTLIVSEESGRISTTLGGTITQGLSEEALRLSLTNHIIIQ